MRIATHRDILNAFPEIQDHAAVEIMEMKATIEDLEAVLAVITSNDKDLIEVKRREGGQIHRLLDILSQANVAAVQDRDI
jgi:DNA-binding transcriptional regulator GbsR (MarR family)